MAKLWKIFSFLIVLAVCLGLTLAPGISWAQPQPPAGTVGLWAHVPGHPGDSVVRILPGESFDMDITVTNPHALGLIGTSVYMEFDGSLLNVAAIVDSPDWPDTLPDNWNNTTGWLTQAGGVGVPVTPITSTTVQHAVVHFTSTGVGGTTTVSFTNNATLGYFTRVDNGTGKDVLDWSAVQNFTVMIGEPPAGISANPSSLSFTTNEGENPPNQTLQVCNGGGAVLDWSLSDGDTAWLGETPTSGSLGEDECEDVTVSVDVTGMEAGDYSATITITGSVVPVSLHIESAAPVGPASVSASGLSITPQQIQPGEEVTISINVANTGGETGSYNAVLYINGVVEDSQSVSVAAGASKNVIFTVNKSQAGVYDVSLAGQSGQFEVVSGGGWFGGGLSTGGIIAIVVVVIALIVGLFLILRGRRRET